MLTTELIPLLFYALCFLLGVSCQLYFHVAYLLIFALLLYFWRSPWKSGCAFLIGGFFYAMWSVTLPLLPEQGISGQGRFLPESVAYGHSPFGSSFITKGTLETFTTSSQTWKKIPCQIYTPLHKERPKGVLEVEGQLLPKTFPNYVLKPAQVKPLPQSFSLAEWRFQIKDWVRQKFSSLFPKAETAAFLLSMVTGEIDDRLMSLQFNRLGLLHLLGVSGFQFSLLAILLGGLLRLILRGAKGTYVLIALLSAYAFILGNSPPIQRAWVGVTLYAISRLAGLQISPLNCLGAALLWELLLEPCVVFQLGFQFSFLCTAAIFIVYPSFREGIKRFLPDRNLSEVKRLTMVDRVGHALMFFCREALALNFAIHHVSLPLILYHFHKFPLLSLAYNLFLPPAVSLAYLFLIPGLILEPISHLLATPFLKMAGWMTDGMLHVATHPPTLFDFQWRVPNLSLGLTLILLALMIGLFYKRSCVVDRLSG